MTENVFSSKISVIIPNLNSDVVDTTIQSLMEQSGNNLLEVIVVGRDDLGRIPSNEKVVFLRTDNIEPPGTARNIGVALAKGDYILFVDADCMASQNLFTSHLRFNESNPNCLLGSGVDFPMKGYIQLSDNVASFHDYMLHRTKEQRRVIPSMVMGLPISLWEKTHGFNAQSAAEDADFCLHVIKLGYSVWFDPDAFVIHKHPRKSILSMITHAYNFGKHSSLLIQEKGTQRTFLQNLALAPFLFYLFSPILALGVIMKMLFKEKLPIRYWMTLPMVFIAKVVWSFGAARHIYAR